MIRILGIFAGGNFCNFEFSPFVLGGWRQIWNGGIYSTVADKRLLNPHYAQVQLQVH
jgi:hypothetical protein